MKQKKIPKSFLTWLKNRIKDEVDIKEIDVEAYYERDLNLSENKSHFEEQFKYFFKPIIPKMTKKEIKRQDIENELKQNKNNLSERFGIEIKLVD